MYLKITNNGTAVGTGVAAGLAAGAEGIITRGFTFTGSTANNRITNVTVAANSAPYTTAAINNVAIAQFSGTQRILVEFYADNRIVADNR